MQPNFGLLKRWSCAIDVFSSGNSGGTISRRIGHPRHSTLSAARASEDGFSEAGTAAVFDPNEGQYRCCCGQSHSTTGVRVIAGMLCATVLYEFWQLCWRLFSSTGSPNPNDPSSLSNSLGQLAFGLCIVATVLGALWRENSLLLLPYLLLQAVGLGAVFIIFLALLYVVLDNDLETVRSLVQNYGPKMEEEEEQGYIVYLGWSLLLSCFCLLLLQAWLISIVFACWRYFRDKQSFFGRSDAARTATSALVVLRPLNRAAEVEEAPDSAAQSPQYGGPVPMPKRKLGSGQMMPAGGEVGFIYGEQQLALHGRTMSVDY